VHAGEASFPLAKKVRAVAFADLLKEVGVLKYSVQRRGM
jgi:hypothetical protein